MAISELLEDAKSYLEKIKKNRAFKAANLSREKKSELQAELLKCAGKLEVCRKDFEYIIKTQSKNIQDGLSVGTDTLIQEQMLWDAAIGYMLVRDAKYAVSTINSYDSVCHAYDMLDAAMKQISGKGGSLRDKLRIGTAKERNAYGYITSASALRDKEKMLELFFEKLKLTGDIDTCLAEAKIPAGKHPDRAYVPGDRGGSAETDDLASRLDAVADESPEDDEDMDFASTNIHPPEA